MRWLIITRKQKQLYNSMSGLLLQLVSIVCGFILPRFFLQYFGSEINGLVASITQFLGFIALMELGIGAVVQTAFYKPLAKKNKNKISEIYVSASSFFKKILVLFAVYLVVLCIAFPLLKSDFEIIFTDSLLLIIAISLIAQYFFGMVNQLLLNADQKSYIYQLITVFSIILNTIICVLLMKSGLSIQIVKLGSSLALLIRPLALYLYVRKNYDIDRNIIIKEEPIKQKWNGIAQHIAFFVLVNTDIIILTLLGNFKLVSIYSIYYLVVSGVQKLLLAATNGIRALFGNMLANGENKKIIQRFYQYEWLMHNLVTLLFTCTAILITPFIITYTSGINDANYNQPLFGVLLTLAYALYCLRLPYNTIVLAAGHYKQTQTSSWIEMIINILISVVLVENYGIIGVACGTIAAMLYRTIYLVYYIRNIINYKAFSYFKHIFIDVIIVSLVCVFMNEITFYGYDYLSWTIYAVKTFTIAAMITIVINVMVYKNHFILLLKKARK